MYFRILRLVLESDPNEPQCKGPFDTDGNNISGQLGHAIWNIFIVLEKDRPRLYKISLQLFASSLGEEAYDDSLPPVGSCAG